MALLYVEPDPRVLMSFANGLEDLTGSSPPDASAIHVPAWTIKPEAIVNGTGASAEQESGCRFYASYATPPGTVSSEMTHPSDYARAKFRNLLDGELAEWGWTRIHQIAQMPELAKADYELHLLIIPGLFVEAFYLRALAEGAHHLVVPLDLHAETLADPVVQDAEAYLAALQPMALARVAAGNDPLMP